MKIAVAGASGLVGSALVPALRDAGHEVVTLVRRPPSSPSEIHWDPDAGTIDAAALAGVDAVVNLAGETIDQRWTEEAKAEILGSRVGTTHLLAETIAGLDPKPSVFVVASGIGYYGNRGDEILTEESSKGSGFLADVVEAWEAAAQPARDAGIRTVHLRQGIVLSKHGGALSRMLTPFKLGAGGKVGNGKQYWPWISLPDTVSAYLWAIEGDASGPVDVVAPEVVTSAQFAKTLGAVLGRPAVVPLPALAVRTMFGEMGEALLLHGQRALPGKLHDAGFRFLQPDLESGLRAALG